MGNRASRCLHCLPDIWVFPDCPFPSLLLKTSQQETPPGRHAAPFGFPGVSTHSLDEAACFENEKRIGLGFVRLPGEFMPNCDRKTHSVVFVIVAAILVLGSAPSFAASCESLATLKLPSTTITSAQEVAAGAFVPPGELSEPGSMFNPKN